MSVLGPLEQFIGEWEGDVGVDLSYHNKEDETAETTYFEKAWFKPIPIVENGRQTMHGLTYQMTAWRHGEEELDPFHDEVGYLLWEPDTSRVFRNFAVPRAMAILCGGHARPDATELTFTAETGEMIHGILQNPYLMDRATCSSLHSTFTFNDDGTLTYTSALAMTLESIGADMVHTDTNTLTRVNPTMPYPHVL